MRNLLVITGLLTRPVHLPSRPGYAKPAPDRTQLARIWSIMDTRYSLSEDRQTLVVKRRTAAGILTSTFKRDRHAGPFTEADVKRALNAIPAASKHMLPGQRNHGRRFVTRFGTLHTGVMTGPPTWRRPRVERGKDGGYMVGWLRLAVAVKLVLGRQAGSGKPGAGPPPASPPAGTAD